MSLDNIILTSLAVAAASMTISKSNAMYWLRNLVTRLGVWFEELIHCPYCLSHWLAAVSVIAWFRGTLGEMIITGLAMVTLASLASLGITHFFLALDALDRSEE